MIEEKRNLLNNITEIFFTRGFYKITMDDIAAELRISKKTIYKYFPTKEFLLNLIIHSIVLTVRNEFRIIYMENKSSVEKMNSYLNFFLKMSQRLSFNSLLEIKKLGPHFWNTVEKLRTREIQKNFGLLIAQGQKEGYIVPFPKEIILTIIGSSMQSIVNPDFVLKNEFSIKQAGQIVLEIIFNGILTDEGKALFEKLKTEKV